LTLSGDCMQTRTQWTVLICLTILWTPAAARRDVAAEVLGTEGFGGAILEVIIRLGGDGR